MAGSALIRASLTEIKPTVKDRIVVVLGAHQAVISARIDLSAYTPVLNLHWSEGIASSIRTGIEALPESAQGVIILLSDQPLIKTAQLETLISTWQVSPENIVASEYHQTVGVPAIFPAAFFKDLRSLKGD